MSTTNGLSTLLQSYYRLQATQATSSASAGKQAGAGSSAGRPDSASISPEAIQALLADMAQSVANSDPWAASDVSDAGSAFSDATASTGATSEQPMTPQEALAQSQQAMLQAEQAFLNPDATGGSTQPGGDMGALMDAYTQGLNQQIAQTIQTAQARMIKAGNTAAPA